MLQSFRQRVRSVISIGACVLLGAVLLGGLSGCAKQAPVKTVSLVTYSSPHTPYPQVMAGLFSQYYQHQPFTPQYEQAKAKNSDTVGWLYVPGTTIDLPVTQTTDNAYYLKHGLDKQYKWKGNPFLDYRDTAASKIQIIYGHNMGDGDLFGQLKKYKDLSFLNKYPLLYFSDGTTDRYFKIFSVFITDLNFDYNEPNFSDDASYESLVKQMTQRSFYNTNVDLRPSDTLLMLSTCTYEFHEARFVVVARMLRMNEEESPWDKPAAQDPNPIGPHGK